MATHSTAPPFTVRSQREGDVLRLRVSGELDLMSCPALSAELESPEVEAAPQVVVELDEVTFLDSRGIAVLVHAATRSRQAGREFRIGSLSAQARRTLELTGVLDSFALAQAAVAPAS